MKKFNKILFPVDLSESSPKIVPYVKLMIRRFEAKAHLLFVVRVFENIRAIYVPNISVRTLEREVLERAEERLIDFREQYFRKFSDITTAVVRGDISEEILNYIEKQNIDLLVLGTHGRKGLEKVIFGSVADRVVKASPVPILLVNPYR